MEQVAVSSEWLTRQIRKLFGSYARTPSVDEIVAYSEALADFSEEEADYAIAWGLLKANGEDDRFPPAAKMLRLKAESFRNQARVGQERKPKPDCNLCKGTGYKMVDENGRNCAWSYHPRQAVLCECRRA